MRARVYDLQFDEWSEAEMARHRVTAREVLQVLDGDPVFLPNKRGHATPIIMTGPTFGGRLLTVPLWRTGAEGVWRPATAWDSSGGERARYEAAH